jgi:putative SOS response-associated peptidase YedK
MGGPVDEPVQSCTIITTEANKLLHPLHERMPVILSRTGYQQWLDPQAKVPALQALPNPAARADLEHIALPV